jgi:hypothetical protein
MQSQPSAGHIEYVDDVGWDACPEEDAARYGLLQPRLIDKGYVTATGGTSYIFLEVFRHWLPMLCRESSVGMCNIMDIRNATVNDMSAVSGYVSWTVKRCANNPVLPMQTSVCIGTQRLEVTVAQDGALTFQRSRPLIDIPPGADQFASQFCVLPVDATKIPRRWIAPGLAHMYNYIRPLFTHEADR